MPRSRGGPTTVTDVLVLLVTAALAAAPEVLPATPVGEAPPQVVVDKLTQLLRSAVQARSAGPTTPAPGAVLAEEARARYFDLDFQGAAELARRSVKRSLEHPEEFGDGSGYVLARVLEALALRELKDQAGAAAAFKAALAVKPDLTLSENDYSPDAIAALARARDAHAQAPATGELTVASAPPFARVFVDGRAWGETPTTVKGLHAGLHVLEVLRDGRLPHRAWFEAGVEARELQLPLAEDPVASLRSTLARALETGAPAPAAEPPSRALAVKLERDVVVVVTGLRGGRVTVSAARVPTTGAITFAATSVDLDLLEANAAIRALAAALLDGSARTVGTPPAAREGEAWLGLMPPAAPAAPEPPPPAITSRPLFWVLMGVGVLAVGGGAAFAVDRVTAPRSVGLSVELPR